MDNTHLYSTPPPPAGSGASSQTSHTTALVSQGCFTGGVSQSMNAATRSGSSSIHTSCAQSIIDRGIEIYDEATEMTSDAHGTGIRNEPAHLGHKTLFRQNLSQETTGQSGRNMMGKLGSAYYQASKEMGEKVLSAISMTESRKHHEKAFFNLNRSRD
ncbi:hypothetical protein BCR39DRAFT_570536 [Naematelia encephala]|uniref:Uncharacterized protein n=1 Tax=Naematelia encephala TaxID=71784 RepID=A0A1Y2AE67_9TREE|nr:hypothetical protein BCR39DRAFT_570536 [Naematelia encephala]